MDPDAADRIQVLEAEKAFLAARLVESEAKRQKGTRRFFKCISDPFTDRFKRGNGSSTSIDSKRRSESVHRKDSKRTGNMSTVLTDIGILNDDVNDNDEGDPCKTDRPLTKTRQNLSKLTGLAGGLLTFRMDLSRMHHWATEDIVLAVSDLKFLVQQFINRNMFYEKVPAEEYTKRELAFLYPGMEAAVRLICTRTFTKRDRIEANKIVNVIIEVMTSLTYLRAAEGRKPSKQQLFCLLRGFQKICSFTDKIHAGHWGRVRRLLLAKRQTRRLEDILVDVEAISKQLTSVLLIKHKTNEEMLQIVTSLPEPTAHKVHRRDLRSLWGQHPSWSREGPLIVEFRQALLELLGNDYDAAAAIFEPNFLCTVMQLDLAGSGHISLDSMNLRFPKETEAVKIADIVLFHKHRASIEEYRWMIQSANTARKLARCSAYLSLRNWSSLISEAISTLLKYYLGSKHEIACRLLSKKAMDWNVIYPPMTHTLDQNVSPRSKRSQSSGNASTSNDIRFRPTTDGETIGGFDAVSEHYEWNTIHDHLEKLKEGMQDNRRSLAEVSRRLAILSCFDDCRRSQSVELSVAGKAHTLMPDHVAIPIVIMLLQAMIIENAAPTKELPVPPVLLRTLSGSSQQSSWSNGTDATLQTAKRSSSSHHPLGGDGKVSCEKDIRCQLIACGLPNQLVTMMETSLHDSWRIQHFACIALVALILPNSVQLENRQFSEKETDNDFGTKFSYASPPVTADIQAIEACLEANAVDRVTTAINTYPDIEAISVAGLNFLYAVVCGGGESTAQKLLQTNDIVEFLTSYEICFSDQLRQWNLEGRFANMIEALASVADRIESLELTAHQLRRTLQAKLRGQGTFSTENLTTEKRCLKDMSNCPRRQIGHNKMDSIRVQNDDARSERQFSTRLKDSSNLEKSRCFSSRRSLSYSGSLDAFSSVSSNTLYEHGQTSVDHTSITPKDAVTLPFSFENRFQKIPSNGINDNHRTCDNGTMRHARLRSLGWPSLGFESIQSLQTVLPSGEDRSKLSSFSRLSKRNTPGTATRNINGLRIFPFDGHTAPLFTNRLKHQHGSTWSSPQRDRQRLSPSIFCSISPSKSYPQLSHNIPMRHHKARDCTYRYDMPSSWDLDDKMSGNGFRFLRNDDRDKQSAGLIEMLNSTTKHSIVNDVAKNEPKRSVSSESSPVERENGASSLPILSDSLELDDDDRDEEITLQDHILTDKRSAPTVTEADISVLRRSSDPADAQAQFELAERFASRTLPENFKDAADLYAKAAKHGHSGARNSLAVCYEYGWGVTKSLETAMKLYLEGAEKGDWSAQRYLGDCYKNGKGVPKDIDKAYEWYAKAGDRDAISSLEKFSSTS